MSVTDVVSNGLIADSTTFSYERSTDGQVVCMGGECEISDCGKAGR